MTLQTCAPENFRLCRWRDERTVKPAQRVSEDPHRRERKFLLIILVLWLNKIIYKNQLSRLPGSSLKVCAVVVVVDGGGGDSGGGGGRVEG